MTVNTVVSDARDGRTPAGSLAPCVGCSRLTLAGRPCARCTSFRGLAAAFLDTCDRTDAFAQWSPSDKQWYCVKKPLTMDRLVRMFEGREEVIGTYFLDDANRVRRVVFDLDAHVKDGLSAEELAAAKFEASMACNANRERLRAILSALCPEAYTLARSKSGKGFHFEIRFREPVPAFAARRMAMALAARAGLVRPDAPDKLVKGVELYPKQDERRGKYGNQVARFGSLQWISTCEGSLLVEPDTLLPITNAHDALRVYTAVSPLSCDDMRSICASVGAGDPFVKEERRLEPTLSQLAERPRNHDPRRISTDLPRWSLQDQEHFLRSSGVVLEQVTAIGGSTTTGWTHRLNMKECPFHERHSSSDKTGAAALYDERTGKMGFNCFHAGCSENVTWSDLRKRLDPAGRFRATARWRAPRAPQPQFVPFSEDACEWPHEPITDEEYMAGLASEQRLLDRIMASTEELGPAPCIVDDRPLAEPQPRTRGSGMPNAWRKKAKEFALANTFGPTARLAARVHRLANCGHLVDTASCEAHGPQGMRAIPCGDRKLCPFCAKRYAEVVREGMTERWPDTVGAAFFDHEPLVDADAVDRVQAHRRYLAKRVPKEGRGRWIYGYTRDIFVFLPDVNNPIDRVESFFEFEVQDGYFQGQAVVTKAQMADLAAEAVYSFAKACMATLDQAGSFDVLKTWGPTARPGIKVTQGYKAGRELYPWPTVEEDRKKKSADELERRGGVPLGYCCAITVGANGSECRCHRALRFDLIHGPTGRVVRTTHARPCRDMKEAIMALNATTIEEEEASPPAARYGHAHYQFAQAG